jgi:lysophospholipid acyltransferase (LPLAT)-like uncharacterized protein
MPEALHQPVPMPSRANASTRPRPLKALWRRIRKPLARSRLVKHALASLMAPGARIVGWTNPLVAGSADLDALMEKHEPAIGAFWHGQHLMAPLVRPRHRPVVALFSRSADAELNAMVAEKLGVGIVRGSGGRDPWHDASKGGAKALIRLKRALDERKHVVMIADIPHGTPRDAGAGIVTLARISGRPILPMAIATSRRIVLHKTWDRMTINLPFGRAALVVGEPITIARDATEAEVETCRQALTLELNAVTERAQKMIDAPR